MVEDILRDDYPVHYNYYYLADGKVVQSPFSGDVAGLKNELGAAEIRRCDAVGRGLFKGGL